MKMVPLVGAQGLAVVAGSMFPRVALREKGARCLALVPTYSPLFFFKYKHVALFEGREREWVL